MPYITNNGVKIHYEVEGQGTPIVFQHGFAATLWTWRDFGYAEALGQEYQLILVDGRGHGESDKPHDPEAYRPDTIANDYIAILDALGIEKAHFMGFSMGGNIGFKCLARYSLLRFYSFIIGGSSPLKRPAVVGSPPGGFTLVLQEAVAKGMDVWLAGREKMLGMKLTPAQRARQLANDPHALLTMQKTTAGWPDAEDILPKITIPVLLFAGDADPSHDRVKEAVKYLPNSSFVSIPGMNHDQSLMHSELVLPHIKRFLAEVGKSNGNR